MVINNDLAENLEKIICDGILAGKVNFKFTLEVDTAKEEIVIREPW